MCRNYHVLKTDHIPKYVAKIIMLLELNKTILVIWGLAKISEVGHRIHKLLIKYQKIKRHPN